MVASASNDAWRGLTVALGWSLVLVVAAIVGCLIALWLKRRLRQVDEPGSTGFTLAELRDMHRRGQLSQEEYERAKAKMVEGALRREARKKAEDKQQ